MAFTLKVFFMFVFVWVLCVIIFAVSTTRNVAIENRLEQLISFNSTRTTGSSVILRQGQHDKKRAAPKLHSTRPTNESESTTHKTVRLYSIHKIDRSGAAIQDMLMAHAYAFSLNKPSPSNSDENNTISSRTITSQTKAIHYEYGGACKSSISSGLKKQIAIRKDLLQHIGLSSVLPQLLDCPANTTADEEGTVENHVMTDKKEYREQDTGIFTEEWRNYILSQVNKMAGGAENSMTRNSGRPNNVYRIAVHIRRQDITPCGHKNKPRFKYRYLPNDHYLRLVDRYRERASNQSIQVEIYSTKQSMEPWTPFEELGYEMHLDTPLIDVWRGLMTADVVILSKSSFSLVPAILNPNATIVYTPFWHKPMPHWEIVDDAFMEQTNKTFHSLLKTCKK